MQYNFKYIFIKYFCGDSQQILFESKKLLIEVPCL